MATVSFNRNVVITDKKVINEIKQALERPSKPIKTKAADDQQAREYFIRHFFGGIMDIKAVRESLGISQRKAAKEAGLSLVGYQNIESGLTKTPRPENIQRIMDMLRAHGWKD